MSSTTAGQPAPDAAAPPPASPWRTPRRQLLVVSGVTLVFEALCGHQLEFVKIIKQTTRRPYPQIVREIVREKGLAGFWDGFLPWGAVQAVSKGAVFGYAYATSRSVLRPLVQDGRMRQHTADTLSGGLAGGVQGFVLSPTLLLKTRVMTDPVFRTQMSLVQTSVRSCQVGARVIVTEGPLSLMKGAPTFACKRVADWGSRYLFTNAVEDALFRRGGAAHAPAKLPYSQQMTASLLGGVLSSIATVPLDVMVAQIQQASRAGQHVSVFGTFAAKYREGGFDAVGGFATRGFVARCLHVSLTTVVVKTYTAMVTDLLEARSK